MPEEKFKPAAGLIAVFRSNRMAMPGYIKAVTLSGCCYIDYPGILRTIKPHEIIDVVKTYEEYRENSENGKYN